MIARKPEQLSLGLPVATALGRGDFLISPANALALAAIEDRSGLPQGRMVLTGPAGAGKTHLLHIWAAANAAERPDPRNLSENTDALLRRTQPFALAIDNAARIAGTPNEEALFHLLNHMSALRGQVLLTARAPVRDWGLQLADLQSRLQAAAHVALREPDEALLAAVLVKLFNDRQLRVQPDLIDYLLSRMERSLAAAGAVVSDLDRAALRLKRPVTRALAQEVLQAEPGAAGREPTQTSDTED
jgi:chromosomal replication initiation ATPase DnaA